MTQHIIIIGAGVAGCALAMLLAEEGDCKVSVYEKRPNFNQLRKNEDGRNINMLLSPRGAETLRQCDVLPEVTARFPKIYGRMVHTKSEEPQTMFVPYGVRKSDDWYNVSISRNELIDIIISKAKSYGVEFYFGYELLSMDVREDRAYCKLLHEGQTGVVSCDLIVGADGLHSAVRARLPVSTTRRITNYCYRELSLGATVTNDFAISPNAIHVFPRGKFFMIALPNEDKTFGCTLVLPEADAHKLSGIKCIDTARAFLKEHFPDVFPHFINLDRFVTSPINPLWDVKCSEYDYKNRVVLIGDAAHTILPFLGQGMNLALEDALILSQLIKKYNADYSIVLPAFTSLRKPNADAIQELSEINFRELSQAIQTKSFQMRKKAELELHKVMPETFAPSPFIIANFLRLPYSKVKERVENSDQLMSEVIWYAKMFGVAVGTILTGSVVKAKL